MNNGDNYIVIKHFIILIIYIIFRFCKIMQEKINMKVDTTAIDQEITNYEKQLRQDYCIKSKLIEETDNLNLDDKHYIRRKSDLDDRITLASFKVREKLKQR